MNIAELSDEQAWKDRHEILFQVRLSGLYHRKRERFIDTLDKIVKAGAVILGTAAISKFFTPEVSQIAIAVISVGSAISLVWGFSERARKHSDLAGKYGTLEAQIVGASQLEFGERDLQKWREQLASLEATEPAVVRRVAKACHEELTQGIYAST